MYDDIAVVTFARRGDDWAEESTTDPTILRERLLDREAVTEAFVLRTCQRVELCARGETAARAVHAVAIDVGWAREARTKRTGKAAVEHLFRVAAGLDSLVLGEDEILGQIRDARADAVETGALDDRLEQVLRKAIRVGERVRTETALGEGNVSIGKLAVDRIERSSDGLDGRAIGVVGAGELASLVVDALARTDADPDVHVINRSTDAARALAARVDGTVGSLDDRHTVAEQADVLVTATGARTLLFEAGDLSGPLLVIDLATPPDVDPAVGEKQGIERVALEAFGDVPTAGLERRRAAIPDAERIVNTELDRLRRSLRARAVDDSISRFRRRAASIEARERDEAIAKLREAGTLNDKQVAIVESFGSSLSASLLHQPTVALREAAADGDDAAVDALLRAFDVSPAVSADSSCNDQEQTVDRPRGGRADQADSRSREQSTDQSEDPSVDADEVNWKGSL